MKRLMETMAKRSIRRITITSRDDIAGIDITNALADYYKFSDLLKNLAGRNILTALRSIATSLLTCRKGM